MRYRALDPNGDYSWGHGLADFLVDRAEAVAQAILTRLNLWTGEWFLDLTEGTAWQPNVPSPGSSGVVGIQPANAARDIIIRSRILGTQGVVSLVEYQSHVDPMARRFYVSGVVETIYDPLVTVSFGLSPAGWYTVDRSTAGGGTLLAAS
jgi:hypothetical protein